MVMQRWCSCLWQNTVVFLILGGFLASSALLSSDTLVTWLKIYYAKHGKWQIIECIDLCND